MFIIDIDRVKKCPPTVIQTDCVNLAAISQNIGHMNWPPVRGNRWFFCTDLLAADRVLRVAAREGPFVRGTR